MKCIVTHVQVLVLVEHMHGWHQKLSNTQHSLKQVMFGGKKSCLFVLCGQGSSLLWTPALRPYSGPVRCPRERKGIGRCAMCVLATCGEGGLSRCEQLVGYFYSVPLLDVAYCLA